MEVGKTQNTQQIKEEGVRAKTELGETFRLKSIKS